MRKNKKTSTIRQGDKDNGGMASRGQGKQGKASRRQGGAEGKELKSKEKQRGGTTTRTIGNEDVEEWD
jgi:hypothetical protein